MFAEDSEGVTSREGRWNDVTKEIYENGREDSIIRADETGKAEGHLPQYDRAQLIDCELWVVSVPPAHEGTTAVQSWIQ
jgi:hypothetical protein